ncbi:ABC transporter substrate-binding protein [Photorhabdus bodei]|uniref:Sugar ABC transporter substrate-binding protein n=1 Tax=Photorhabdus laumondii subsp. clarkei TaxID=2029685 RepID=A0A329VPD0_9GAMM|nr:MULTISPECIES: ABC transporter substrate-binding protein [Photorhabdus]MDB6367470.1 ABC transporter substrate-binding protein [Photorhabdus bodei]RAW93572.1 sugar ABC transporter substrate-binding protein [Photorhabdus laumondii subsp. clarkei]
MTISFITDQITPVTKSFIKQVVDCWNSNQSNRSVNLIFIDHEELRDSLESYLTRVSPPDVLTWFSGNRMKSFMERELMIKTESIKGIEKFYELLQPRFQKMFDEGDARYFVPTSYFWWAIYYCPSIFRQVGIDTPINNWQELTVAAEKLRSSGIVPFSLGSRYRCPAVAWFDYLNMRLNGPDFHQQLMDLKIPYTDERIKTVFSFFRKLQDNGWFLGKANSYDEEEAVEAVLSGKAGMTLIGSYVQDEYVPSDCIEKLDFFRFPIINEHVAVGEDTPIDGFFAAGRSNNPRDAGDFLLYLGSRDVQALATKLITALPTRSDIDIRNLKGDLAKGREIIDHADNLFQFYDLDTPWEIADVGMSFINDFASYEVDESIVQHRIEDARLRFLGCFD